jgi:phosphosulfolactate synthase
LAHAFEGLDGIGRPGKIRTTGLCMVVDWGIGLRSQEDLLDTSGFAMDFGKIAVGVSRLLRDEVLRAKITSYKDALVEPFPGGQYFEYAESIGKAETYLPACAEVGYGWVEVSDNMAEVTLEWKERMIRSAVQEFDMKVLGEVGKKDGLGSDTSFVDDAKRCADAGSTVVLLEAAELVGDDADVAADVEAVVKALGLETVMFELPGPWIAGVSQHDVHAMRRDLLSRYGLEVNIGNVMPDDVMSLEAYRRGLGVNAGQSLE